MTLAKHVARLGIVALLTSLVPGQVGAQEAGDAAPAIGETGAEAAIRIELNGTAPLDGACRLTFVVHNDLATEVAGIVLETVLLTRDGAVDRLTLFDMQALPAGRPRVRQFDVLDLDCADLGQVLINGVESCEGPATGGDADDALDPAICGATLSLTSRIDVEMLG